MAKLRTIYLCCALVSLALPPAAAFAADCDPWVARLLSLEGKVEVRRKQITRWLPATTGETYCFGDQLRVGARSRASIELNNDTILRLDQKSLLILPEAKQDRLSFVELIRGALHIISRVKGRLEIRTPFVNAGLEGTEFVVRVLDNEAVVSVIEGEVRVSNTLGSLQLTGGQTASASQTTAPVLRYDLKPADAVHWAIYYPLIADPDRPGLAGGIGEAQRLLQVGQAQEAGTAIEKVLATTPQDVDALALAAIIELAQNRKIEALALARDAVAKRESSPSLLALSYAQQASFDLPAALASAQRATTLFPDLALPWVRVAELQASLGRREAALAAAHRAVAIDPALSRTQTVLGFAELASAQTAAASAAFDRAIELDSTDPLPRLGLGLAKIRTGELAAGRREMEIAVSLDPANSLVRSYLGKAYAEEGRGREAEAEFELARQLDPLDPTPWLYDALRKQAENRPIVALRDLEQSVALNDNRAVYRSELLLDDDRAVRNSSIGAVYADLGLRDLARRHASRSLALDPGNASAHALMAESYRDVPRRGITRLSERLQAQMLQPLTSRPTTPSELVRERDPSAGARRFATGANEYSALFDNHDPRFYLAGFVGGNDSVGIELVHSRLLDKASYSVGYHKFDTEGFRSDADFEYETYNAFLQYAVSDDLSLQFEARHQNKDQGDLRLDPRGLSNEEERSLDYDLFRAGVTFDFSDRNLLLVSLTHADRGETAALTELVFGAPGVSKISGNKRAWITEIQLQHRRENLQVVGGGGIRKIDSDYSSQIDTIFFTSASSGDEDISSSSAYLYTHWQVFDDFIWTLGFSHDEHDDPNRGDRVRFSRLNPKLGVQWRLSPQLNLRAAHVGTTKHQLVAEETIEPTQVAGFAQFYDDFNRSEADLTAVAVDFRLSESLFGTIEHIKRDADQVDSSTSLDEKSFKTEVSALFGDRWAASVGYEYQKDEVSGLTDFDLVTKMIPFSISYRSSNGLFGSLDWTLFDQDLRPSGASAINTDFNAVSFNAGYAWNRKRNRIVIGVDDVLNDVGVYRDERHKSNDQLNVYRPFVPGRTFWASIELTLD